jgi:hypothetical protein
MPVASLIDSRRVHRFLYLGDVYNYGTAAEFEQNYKPVFGRFDPIAAPTIGNHEYDNRVTGYDPYWTAARGQATPPWYSFSVAGWQFLSLNAMEPAGEGSQQLDWLRRRLAQTPRFGSCRIAFMHFPRYSAGPDGGTHGDHHELAAVWDAMVGRARMFLAGHNHHMERRIPVDGITQLISGAGGRELSNADESDPGAAFVEDGLHGALRLRLRRGFAQASFIGVDGDLLDVSPISCNREPSAIVH